MGPQHLREEHEDHPAGRAWYTWTQQCNAVTEEITSQQIRYTRWGWANNDFLRDCRSGWSASAGARTPRSPGNCNSSMSNSTSYKKIKSYIEGWPCLSARFCKWMVRASRQARQSAALPPSPPRLLLLLNDRDVNHRSLVFLLILLFLLISTSITFQELPPPLAHLQHQGHRRRPTTRHPPTQLT